MADNKRGREEQSRGADNRQRQRDVAAELERWDETEPPFEETALDDFTAELESVSFPATGAAVVSSVGDLSVESTASVAELVPESDEVTYETPDAVRTRVQRPTVAAAMKAIVEASEGPSNPEFSHSQREAYGKTFRALKAIDADDDDEGVRFIREWIVEQIDEQDRLPGSRKVRKRAATFCRSNGYTVRDDEWLGA